MRECCVGQQEKAILSFTIGLLASFHPVVSIQFGSTWIVSRQKNSPIPSRISATQSMVITVRRIPTCRILSGSGTNNMSIRSFTLVQQKNCSHDSNKPTETNYRH